MLYKDRSAQPFCCPNFIHLQIDQILSQALFLKRFTFALRDEQTLLMASDLTLFFLDYIRSNYTFIEYQISSPQELEETRLYYIEVLFKQGRGFARMHIAMRTPGGEMITPISSTHLVKHLTKHGEYH